MATEWLSAEEVLERAPFLRPDGLQAGTFHARDGMLDPYGVARAMEREARGLGVRIVTDAEVRAIRRTDDGFRVEHDGGVVEGPGW